MGARSVNVSVVELVINQERATVVKASVLSAKLNTLMLDWDSKRLNR
jgi:hypothetical protein